MSNKFVTIENEKVNLLGPLSLSTQRTCSLVSFLAVIVPLLLGIGVGILIGWFGLPHMEKAPQISPLCYPSDGTNTRPKNLIYFIGDGFGPSAVTLTRILSGSNLNMDPYLIGTAKTFSYNTLVTDSAAAATALACGIKTNNDQIGVFANGTAVGTIMEAAIAAGLSAGLVVTSSISHATPAGFSAHAIHRESMPFISYQQVQKNIDVLFGGGLNFFQAVNNKSLSKAIEMGYNIVYTKDDMSKIEIPALGIFAKTDLTFMIDRPAATTEPTLSEMASRALDLLTAKNNPKGFFLMIEGSRIDHAEHGNDVATAYYEAQEYDKTIKLAMDFATKNGDTLVLATADHETGGLSLGANSIYAYYPEIILAVKKSCEFIAREILSQPETETVNIFLNYSGLASIPIEDQQRLISARSDFSALRVLVAQLISKQALIGWTTLAHTGVDVNIYGYGPGVHNFCGNLDNTELALKIATIFEWDTDIITKSLADFDTSGNNYTLLPDGTYSQEKFYDEYHHHH